eukprot:CAMPEP_0194095828 /NCGR_PEP_ID=MMETSP0149-20130528/57029_1 /TAXON_ID=122233 /ORGANISM="Chaetoceros debilis, Strain MM31A-1" /LENGTH=667 /DNA_ID=CAMNT_0038781787 /DNA_START=79 /DNA_END=2078 /DNA_ORIENTATION=+
MDSKVELGEDLKDPGREDGRELESVDAPSSAAAAAAASSIASAEDFLKEMEEGKGKNKNNDEESPIDILILQRMEAMHDLEGENKAMLNTTKVAAKNTIAVTGTIKDNGDIAIENLEQGKSSKWRNELGSTQNLPGNQECVNGSKDTTLPRRVHDSTCEINFMKDEVDTMKRTIEDMKKEQVLSTGNFKETTRQMEETTRNFEEMTRQFEETIEHQHITMIPKNINEAVGEGERMGEVKDEEGQPLLETVLEQVRLQQEENRLQQEKMNQQDRAISNLRDEMRNMRSELESTSDSDAIARFYDNPPLGAPVEQQQDVESQPSAASGRQRPRRTGGSSPLSNILRRNRSRSSNQSLPEDIFTMMMMSRPCSASWALGIFVWACQMSLCFLIMIELGHEAGIVGSFLSGYNWLTRPDATVYIGQFISIIFVTLAQGDMFSSVRTIQWLRKNTRWDIILLGKEENEDPPSIWDWILHILIPNVLKFIQGFAVFFVSFFIIMTRSNLLDLIKDFTSLMIVSELDNIAFDFTAYGYLGESLYLKTIDAQDIEIDDIAQQQGGFGDWILHILIPNVLKFIQGFAVFFVSFFIIMTRSNLLDLIKDFTSLMIVSELDNIAFDFTAYGYLGESLYLKTIDAQDIEIDDIAQQQGGRFIFRKLWAWVLLGLTLAIW